MAERGRDLRHVAASRGKLLAFGMPRNGGWLLLVGALATAASCSDAAAPQEEDPPAQYVSVRRAWLPGERDSAIARVMRGGGLGPFSSLAPFVFADPDSYTTIAPNPLYHPSAGLSFDVVGTRAPQFAASWLITGMDIRIIDNSQSPPDTTDWLGVFWSNTSPPAAPPDESTWKGFVYAASALTTVANTAVNTTAFDASGGKSGAGGGEVRQSTGEYWEGNSGTIRITSGTYGAATPVASGPYTGGTTASGLMQGRMLNIGMPRVLPSPGTAITVDFDFRFTAIDAVQLTCIFPSPCTGQAARVLLAARREGRLSAALMAREEASHAPELGRRRLP